MRCTFLKAEKLMVLILLNPNVCHCVLEQNALAALPHTNVRECSVVVGGTVWCRLASMLPPDCPMAAVDTRVVYHQRVNMVWMNNGFHVKRFECLEKRPYTSLKNEHHQRLFSERCFTMVYHWLAVARVWLNTWVRCRSNGKPHIVAVAIGSSAIDVMGRIFFLFSFQGPPLCKCYLWALSWLL